MKKTFSCTFTLVFYGSKPTFIKQKSKLVCTPNKPKNVRFKKLVIEGQLGNYTVTGTINPDIITTAIFGEEGLHFLYSCLMF